MPQTDCLVSHADKVLPACE